MEILDFKEWLRSVKKLPIKEIETLSSNPDKEYKLLKEYRRFVNMWRLRGIIE